MNLQELNTKMDIIFELLIKVSLIICTIVMTILFIKLMLFW